MPIEKTAIEKNIMLSIQDKIDLTPSNAADIQSDPLGLTPPKVDNRKRFLKFLLSQEHHALLPLECVVEVMQLPRENVLPIPDMSSCIPGVCSWQGETLWLIDLNYLVGYKSLYQQIHLLKTPSVVVVQHEDKTLGLVVEQVIDIDLLDESTVHMDPKLCPPELESFTVGHCLHQDSVLLNVSAIVNDPQLHTYGEYS
ncbi:MAG: chemotaxis protein CheW [Cyanobacteria bacterium J06621_11]